VARGAAAALLVTWFILSGLRASGAGSASAPGASAELASPYQQYQLKLRPFVPIPGRPAGVLLQARINGGQPLRLLLDSGAEFIVIGAKTGRSVGLSARSEMELIGLGSRAARVGRAATVEIGPVRFRNCPVVLVDSKVVEGADGVIPLSLFSDFLLRLNLPQKTLGLIPYPREESPPVPPARGVTKGVTKHDVLLVAAVLNGKRNGYVVVDTGAFCSAVSHEVAPALSGFQIVPEVRLAAGTGAAIGQRLSSTAHFAIAKHDLIADEVVALDLSNLSQHYGVEVIGVLGFRAFARSVLTIDYRTGRVEIGPPQSVSARELNRGRNAEPHAALAFR